MKNLSLLLLIMVLSGLSLGNVAQGQSCASEDATIPGNLAPVNIGGDGSTVLCTEGRVRFNDPVSTTYSLDAYGNQVEIVVDNAGDCGPVFSWRIFNNTTPDGEATVVIESVKVKGGNSGNNAYYYADNDLQLTTDGNLHAPINPSDIYAGLSHIDFCFRYVLTVTKDAHTAYTRTYGWNVTKEVTPASWKLFTGDSGTSDYTITVDRDEGTDSDWAVTGTITIENNTPFDATIENVSDVIADYAGEVSLDCGLTFPYTLASGTTLTCSYSAAAGADAETNPFGNLNTATVTTSGIVDGGEATAAVDFTTATVTEVDATATVTDDWATPGDPADDATYPFDGDGSVSYSITFNCNGNEGTRTNTATIVGDDTGTEYDSDDATVTVHCYALTVTKDATTTFTRTWDWMIDKYCTGSLPGDPNTAGSSSDDPLLLSPGQSYPTEYQIDVSATFQDGSYAVSGEITISNPHPDRAADLTEVTDVISDFGPVTVDCGGATSVPAATAAGPGTLVCSYSADLPDASTRTNTATATLQNYAFAADGTSTGSGTTSFSSDQVPVTFDDTPDEEVDPCANVTDTNPTFAETYGDVNGIVQVCATPTVSTFSYVYVVDRVAPEIADCGPSQLDNTASVNDVDTGAPFDDANCSIYIVVPCDFVCTLTPGYWKTHNESFYGGASKKADPAWYDLDPYLAEQAPFFPETFAPDVAPTYYDVLWTSPQGNVYYNLARAYIAAVLNGLNGADDSAIEDDLTDALAFFGSTTPADAADLKGKDRKTYTELAQRLDDYNNGLIGPGHCYEDDSSADGLAASSTNLTIAPFADDQLPTGEYLLEQNRPNPFLGHTTIGFRLPEANKVLLRVYNLNGQVVATLTDSHLEAGYYQLTWNVPRDVPAGIYFYRLEAGDTVLTERMQLQR